MAKLSARGRIELARVSKEKTMPEIGLCNSCKGTGKYENGETCIGCEGKGQRQPLTCWERITLTLMSDRTILEKLDVRFNDANDPKGYYPHSYGWKVKGKLKKDLDTQKFIDIYVKAGYTKE